MSKVRLRWLAAILNAQINERDRFPDNYDEDDPWVMIEIDGTLEELDLDKTPLKIAGFNKL